MSDAPRKWFPEFRALPLGQRVSIVLQALQVVAIVAGAAWFIFEYRANVTNRAKEESLKYVAKANESSVTDGLVMMRKPSEDDASILALRSAIKTSFTTKDICPVDSFYQGELSRAYYSTDAGKDRFYSKLNQLIVFYTSLSICATSHACDLYTTCDFFFADVKEFVTRHCTLFDRRTIIQGQSPVLEIERFLRGCARLDKFKVPSLTYCEDIRNAAGKQVHELNELYQACRSDTASPSSSGG